MIKRGFIKHLNKYSDYYFKAYIKEFISTFGYYLYTKALAIINNLNNNFHILCNLCIINK